MNFGTKFKFILEQKGITYEEACSALGYKSKGSIANLTKMDFPPRGDKLQKICSFLGVPIGYFDETPSKVYLGQNQTEYETSGRIIPLYEDESEDARLLTEMVFPQIGETDVFAIEITDDRLATIGISKGTTLFLQKNPKLSGKQEVIADQEGNRFFALYEKRGNEEFLTPANPEQRLIELGGKGGEGIEIYAAVIRKLITV